MIPSDLQQWNIMTDGQVLAVTVYGAVSYLAFSAGVAGGCGFKGAVGTELKQIVLVGGALCSLHEVR